MELVNQDVKYQYWLFLKKELSCSTCWGENILSECKGPVQRGGVILHVVTHDPLDVCFTTSSTFSSPAQTGGHQQSKNVIPPKGRGAVLGGCMLLLSHQKMIYTRRPESRSTPAIPYLCCCHRVPEGLCTPQCCQMPRIACAHRPLTAAY